LGRIPDVVERDVVWLRPSGSEWRVAQPSLLAYRVFESQPGTPRWLFEEPVPAAALSRPARLPRGFDCSGVALAARDPTGRADRGRGRATAWVDVSQVRISHAGNRVCIAVRTLAPVRPLTAVRLWIEQPKANVFTSVEVRLGSRSRPTVTATGLSVPRLRAVRVGRTGTLLSISLPARRLGLKDGRFGWSLLSIFNEPRPGTGYSDHWPNTRLRLLQAYPDGKPVREMPRH
jgi:hypothetical protein